MSHVRVWTRIKASNSGSMKYLPVILIEVDGKLKALEPLLRYLNEYSESHTHSWMLKLCEIVGLLIDYIDANKDAHCKPVSLFREFVRALYNGTIGESNLDPSGLYWIPSRTATVNPKIAMLSNLSQWMVNNGYVSESLNPWTPATTAEQRFNYLAWCKKNDESFLKHLGPSRKASAAVEEARSIKLRRPIVPVVSTPKVFPVSFEVALLRQGFVRHGKDNSLDPYEKYDWRGICIAMLLLYGGRRLSEPFHLWIGDVMENPNESDQAYVRIFHPVEGAAPADRKINGRHLPNRQAYLQAFYPKYPPRNFGIGNYEAGFKSRFLIKNGNYLVVHWGPREMGKVFMQAWNMYMWQRIKFGVGGDKHPFAFVSHKGKSKGEPYTMKSFEASWERAIHKIGLQKIKSQGTSTHGPRHGYARKAKAGNVEPDALQIALGHSSIKSQEVYGKPGIQDVSEMMDMATKKIGRFDVEIMTRFYEHELKSQGVSIQSSQFDFNSIFMNVVEDQRDQYIRRNKRNA